MKKIRCHYCGGDVHVENHVSLSLCNPCKVKAGYDPVGFALSLEKPIVKNGGVVNKRVSEDFDHTNEGGMLLASCLAVAMASSDAQSNDALSGGESGGAGAEGSF